MDVSCEFLSKKNNNNSSKESQNIYKERTDFYRLNIPIIPKQKKNKFELFCYFEKYHK